MLRSLPVEAGVAVVDATNIKYTYIEKIIISYFSVSRFLVNYEQHARFETLFDTDIYKPALRDFQPRIRTKVSENINRF